MLSSSSFKVRAALISLAVLSALSSVEGIDKCRFAKEESLTLDGKAARPDPNPDMNFPVDMKTTYNFNGLHAWHAFSANIDNWVHDDGNGIFALTNRYNSGNTHWLYKFETGKDALFAYLDGVGSCYLPYGDKPDKITCMPLIYKKSPP